MPDIQQDSSGLPVNRRDFPRVAAAHLVCLCAPSGAVLAGRTMDLALDGLGVELYGVQALGEPVTGERLTVTLAMHGELAEIEGVIVRCRGFADEGHALAMHLPSPSRDYRRLLAETFADAT